MISQPLLAIKLFKNYWCTNLARASHFPVWGLWLEVSRLTRVRWGISHQKPLPVRLLTAERPSKWLFNLHWLGGFTAGHCPSQNKARTRGNLLYLKGLVVRAKHLSTRAFHILIDPSKLNVWALWQSSMTSFSRSPRLRYLWLRILSWCKFWIKQRKVGEGGGGKYNNHYLVNKAWFSICLPSRQSCQGGGATQLQGVS